jgi:hypothetical protein
MSQVPSERIAGFGVTAWAYLVALVMGVSIADDLLRIPIQVADSLEEIVVASRSESLLDTFWQQVHNGAYLRPVRIVTIEALFKLSNGHYWLVYRGFHALLLIATLLLFTRALGVRTRTDLLAAAFALTVLTGGHTFPLLVHEAFPINHFLEIACCSLAVLNLSQSRGGWWVDVGAMLLFVGAALTLESGLLVWVVAVTARLAGWRGISWRAIAGMTLLVGAYFGWRARWVSLPTLAERRSGYLFEVFEPDQLAARFGNRLWWLRGYNVMAATSSVLFAEPRDGMFALTKSIRDGVPAPGLVVTTVSTALTTILIGVAAFAGRRPKPGGRSSEPDSQTLAWRYALVFAAVLGASAAMSYVYVKDDIMTTAGVFYSLAAFAAVRWAWTWTAHARPAVALVVTALFVVVGVGWSVESLGVHYVARSAAFKTRSDWAYQPRIWKQEGRWPTSEADQRLLDTLRREATSMPAPNPRFREPWMETMWER